MLTHTLLPLNSTHIPTSIEGLLSTLDNVIVIKDGHIIKQQLTDAFSKVLISDFNHADQHLMTRVSALKIPQKAVLEYNQEALNSSLFVFVPKDLKLNQTLHIFYLQDTIDMIHNTMILLDENASLKTFEYIHNASGCAFNFVSKAYLNRSSQLSTTSVSALTHQCAATLNRLAHLEEDAEIDYINALFGDALTEQDTSIILQGERAKALNHTIAFTSKTQEAFVRTLIEHNAKRTEGKIEHYGVANDQSFLVFEGIGQIHKGMIQSNARQNTKGIVLGAQARLDANPLLLIDEYDIEAGHGAAIGQIDEEQLYYMMSRGLTRKHAERLIINSFIEPIKAQTSNQSMHTHIDALLMAKTQ